MKRNGILLLLCVMLVAMCSLSGMAQQQATPGSPSVQQTTTPASQPDSASKPAGSTSQQSVATPAEYKLQREDILRFSVVGEPELAGEQVVDPNGYINIPMLGQVHAEGLTRDELSTEIKKGLSKYLVDPKVQITLSDFRKPKVFVLGQVNRPGVQEYRPGDRVMEAIAQAGSFTDNAYLEKATLTHKGSNEPVAVDLHKLFFNGDMTQNQTLQDGDTIYVPDDNTNKFFVLGEVNRPGKYPLKDNTSIMDAISNASGPTQRASIKTTYIIRGDPKNPERIRVDVNKLLKSGDMTQNMALKPGDVVYVPETSKPDWSKIANVLSVVVNSSYLVRMWGW